jgi:hypothetical protein
LLLCCSFCFVSYAVNCVVFACCFAHTIDFAQY